MTDKLHSPPSGGWDGIRMRYEAGVEKVADIAKSIGMTGIALSLKAKADGWMLRTQTNVMKTTVRVSAGIGRTETTQETLRRLKELLQLRIGQLEKELADIGEELDAISRERQIRSVNTVVRTLEKVLDLERKDINRRKRARRDFKHFDEAQRVALAEKIDRIETEGPGAPDGGSAGPDGGAGAQPSMAVLGASHTAVAGANSRGDQIGSE
jgi:hypothetical protein